MRRGQEEVGGTLQNICSAYSSLLPDPSTDLSAACSLAVAVSSGIVERNSVSSASHFAVHLSAPATPGSPAEKRRQETQYVRGAQPSVERERSSRVWMLGRRTPLAIRAGQQRK